MDRHTTPPAPAAAARNQNAYNNNNNNKKPSYFTLALRWLRLKNYQYEVSSSLYMLTPTEKIIFNMILLVLMSLLLMAAFLYLPNHISVISNRVWYYAMGEFRGISSSAGSTKSAVGGSSLSSLLSQTRISTATEIVGARAGEL